MTYLKGTMICVVRGIMVRQHCTWGLLSPEEIGNLECPTRKDMGGYLRGSRAGIVFK